MQTESNELRNKAETLSLKTSTMDSPKVTPEKIIERLKLFNYKYQRKDNQLKIFLPAGCSLKMYFYESNVEIVTFSIGRWIMDLRILVFVYVTIILIGIGILQQNPPYNHIDKGNGSLVILLGVFLLIYFFIRMIIILNMKSIIHHWVEHDLKN